MQASEETTREHRAKRRTIEENSLLRLSEGDGMKQQTSHQNEKFKISYPISREEKIHIFVGEV